MCILNDVNFFFSEQMIYPLVGLLLGVVLGFFYQIPINSNFSSYVAIFILAALDSLFGALKADLQKKYNSKVFISGLVMNLLIAAFFVFLGERLQLDLYLVVTIVLGTRIFENLTSLRRSILR